MRGRDTLPDKPCAALMTPLKSRDPMTPRGLSERKPTAPSGRSFRSSTPYCGSDIPLIAFFMEPGPIWEILTHIG